MPCRPHDISSTAEKFYHPNILITHVRLCFFTHADEEHKLMAYITFSVVLST